MKLRADKTRLKSPYLAFLDRSNFSLMALDLTSLESPISDFILQHAISKLRPFIFIEGLNFAVACCTVNPLYLGKILTSTST